MKLESEYRKHLKPTLNIADMPTKVSTKVKVVVNQGADLNRFQIRDYVNRSCYCISWCEEGMTNPKKKAFYYKRIGREAAMAKAEIYRKELIKKYY